MIIQTKYLPATNTRGSRIKATYGAPHMNLTVTVSFDHALSAEENHRVAMRAMTKKCQGPIADMYVGDTFAGAMYWVNKFLA
jgi:hypothetical protein